MYVHLVRVLEWGIKYVEMVLLSGWYKLKLRSSNRLRLKDLSLADNGGKI